MRAYSTNYKKSRKQSHVIATGQESGEMPTEEEEEEEEDWRFGGQEVRQATDGIVASRCRSVPPAGGDHSLTKLD